MAHNYLLFSSLRRLQLAFFECILSFFGTVRSTFLFLLSSHFELLYNEFLLASSQVFLIIFNPFLMLFRAKRNRLALEELLMVLGISVEAAAIIVRAVNDMILEQMILVDAGADDCVLNLDGCSHLQALRRVSRARCCPMPLHANPYYRFLNNMKHIC
jgi:hypothetical protein